MRMFALALLVAVALLSQEKKPSALDNAKTEWKNAAVTITRLTSEAAQLAAEWQNRQTQIRDAQLRQKEAELVLQAELCKPGERIVVEQGVDPRCAAPPKEKKQ